MLIRKITIRNFGKLNNRTFEFSDGINVIFGENESGKTTLHHFIRSMFYGVPRGRGKSTAYRAYEPWENPAEYGGTIWFDSLGMSWRLTRNFSREHPFQELLCMTTGEVMDPDEDDVMTEILGDVSEAVYDNTVSIGQMKSVTGPSLAKELQNYMAGYEGSGDSSIDIQRASQMLKMTRKGYQVQEDHRKKALEAEEIRIRSRIDYLEEEEKKLENKKAVLQRKIYDLDPEGEGSAPYDDQVLNLQKRARTAGLGAAILSSCLLVLALLVVRSWPRAAAVAAAVILLAIGFFRRNILEKEAEGVLVEEEQWKQEMKELKWNLRHTEKDLAELMTSIDNLYEDYNDVEDDLYQVSAELTEVRAVNLALETIGQLSGSINLRIGGRLRQRTSEIFADITGEKYAEVLIDDSLKMSVNTEDRVIPLDRLSRGTLEQIYFALRIAAGELFCGDETFPLILDDVFGNYDEDRLEALLKWIYKENRQVLLSTCSGREAALMEGAGIPYKEYML